MHPSLAFSYMRRVTESHSSSGSQPNFAEGETDGIAVASTAPGAL